MSASEVGPRAGQPGVGEPGGGPSYLEQPRPASAARRRWIGGALAAAAGAAPLGALLGGCAGPPRTDYHLWFDGAASPASPASTAAAPAAPRIDQVLLIAGGTAAALYDTDRMVFSADGASRSYFQYGFWAERPQRRLVALAEAHLARADAFRAVALSTSGIRGGLLLTLRLDALYVDNAADPALARLAFSADLVDWRDRRLIARRSFDRSEPMARHDASAFAAAASRAVGALLADLNEWAIGVAAA